jgi:hypothetical protein
MTLKRINPQQQVFNHHTQHAYTVQHHRLLQTQVTFNNTQIVRGFQQKLLTNMCSSLCIRVCSKDQKEFIKLELRSRLHFTYRKKLDSAVKKDHAEGGSTERQMRKTIF